MVHSISGRYPLYENRKTNWLDSLVSFVYYSGPARRERLPTTAGLRSVSKSSAEDVFVAPQGVGTKSR